MSGIRKLRSQRPGIASQATSSSEKWTPHVNKIVQQLQSGDSATKLKAIESLEKIEDEDAVYAIQYAALQVDDAIAMPLVESMLRFRSKQACVALCQVALKNPHSNVGLQRSKD